MKIRLRDKIFLDEKNVKNKLASFIVNNDKLSMGPKCLEFEKKFSQFQETKYSVMVNSGSSANLLIFQTLINMKKLKYGDLIAFSSLTWSTNVMPLISLGFKLLPIDTKIENFNIDINDFLKKIKKNKVKCLFVTNALGLCANLVELKKICKINNIILIEDNCEGLGTKMRNTLTGNFGLCSSFSFYIAHHLSTIEGGMICTKDKEFYNNLLIARAHGWLRDVDEKEKFKILRKHRIKDNFDFKFFAIGYNLRPTEINGYSGLLQLKNLKKSLIKRSLNYLYVTNFLKKKKYLIQHNTEHIDFISSFCIPFLFISKKMKKYYEKKFSKKGIENRPIIGGNICNQPFFKNIYKKKFSLKGSDLIDSNGFYITNHSNLSKKQLDYVLSMFE